MYTPSVVDVLVTVAVVSIIAMLGCAAPAALSIICSPWQLVFIRCTRDIRTPQLRTHLSCNMTTLHSTH